MIPSLPRQQSSSWTSKFADEPSKPVWLENEVSDQTSDQTPFVTFGETDWMSSSEASCRSHCLICSVYSVWLCVFFSSSFRLIPARFISSTGAPPPAAFSSQHDLYLDVEANSLSQNIVTNSFCKLLGGPSLFHPIVPCSWGSWLTVIIAAGHLHFRPIFHPVHFSLSKDRRFDVPQISLWLTLSTGKDWFPLVLQRQGGNERGKIPVERNPNGYCRSRGGPFQTHSANSLMETHLV